MWFFSEMSKVRFLWLQDVWSTQVKISEFIAGLLGQQLSSSTYGPHALPCCLHLCSPLHLLSVPIRFSLYHPAHSRFLLPHHFSPCRHSLHDHGSSKFSSQLRLENSFHVAQSHSWEGQTDQSSLWFLGQIIQNRQAMGQLWSGWIMSRGAKWEHQRSRKTGVWVSGKGSPASLPMSLLRVPVSFPIGPGGNRLWRELSSCHFYVTGMFLFPVIPTLEIFKDL